MKAKRWAQFNIRIDADLLDSYREHCREQAIDPHGYVIKRMEELVQMKPKFLDRMWEEVEKSAKDR